MEHPLTILNLPETRFECTYGRGCEGTCCREGRPRLYPEEIERIDANLHKFLPLLRRVARGVVKRVGYVSRRRLPGHAMARNAGGWCVFFNQGCVLHKAGADEGDKLLYKPAVCALFPIQADDDGNWYVRQHGYKKEKWDLFCLDPRIATFRRPNRCGRRLRWRSSLRTSTRRKWKRSECCVLGLV